MQTMMILLSLKVAAFELEAPTPVVEEEQELDDRTLLDIFGEVTKEYLTQRVVSSVQSLSPSIEMQTQNRATPLYFTLIDPRY